jgi:hypothetical protein
LNLHACYDYFVERFLLELCVSKFLNNVLLDARQLYSRLFVEVLVLQPRLSHQGVVKIQKAEDLKSKKNQQDSVENEVRELVFELRFKIVTDALSISSDSRFALLEQLQSFLDNVFFVFRGF